MSGVHDFSVYRLDGREEALSSHEGKVLLIVNVASRCGFTPQYAGLETLWRDYGPRGLVVMGFPCNQFGAQEPGDATEIAQFCSTTYSVTFPLYAKIEVNGADAHPFFRYLKHAAPGILGTEAIKWNFTKFLVNRQGEVVERFAPGTTPAELAARIEALL